MSGYAVGAVSGNNKVSGLAGNKNNDGTVRGYALGYVTPIGSSPKNIGPGVGEQESGGKSTAYVGRIQAEEQAAEKKTAGSGDHAANGTSTGLAPTGVVIEGSDSKKRASFSGLVFGTKDWEWKMDSSKQWPIMNIPASFPGGDKQNPRIPAKPNDFAELIIAPDHLKPKAGATTDYMTTDFSWDAVTGAASCGIQIADSEKGLESAMAVSIVVTSCTPAAALPNYKAYYWRMRALNSGVQKGEWSAAHKIHVVNDGCIRVKSGTFEMGTPKGMGYDAQIYDKERPVHDVTLKQFLDESLLSNAGRVPGGDGKQSVAL